MSGRQRIVGVENIGDNDIDYNQYEEMTLFTSPENMKYIKASIDKTLMPYLRRDGDGKVV